LNKGYAYISNGSVYFDVPKYNADFGYGKLSGRVLEEMISNTRALDGQDEKHHPADFALWKKASPEHIMRWRSPWSLGFPGWHIECTAMSTKYLGDHFDIHGGGMDLLFPHHESEVCQATVLHGKESVKYWMHNNMITTNGQKMGKSLGNFITLNQFFTGEHPLLERAYLPMTIRYFILQAHYRGTVDFSNEALIAAEKGLQKLYAAEKLLDKLPAKDRSDENITAWVQMCYDAMNDDLNTPKLIAELFDAVRIINSVKENHLSLTQKDIELLNTNFRLFFYDILGMLPEVSSAGNNEIVEGLMNMIMEMRHDAKLNKNWAVADSIRNHLTALGITIKDTKEGAVWEM
jgi:cysteinyl-tRNA synthetase